MCVFNKDIIIKNVSAILETYAVLSQIIRILPSLLYLKKIPKKIFPRLLLDRAESGLSNLRGGIKITWDKETLKLKNYYF